MRSTVLDLDAALALVTVYWIREGKIARRQVFWNRRDALKASGLAE
jgi:hypothetical protein